MKIIIGLFFFYSLKLLSSDYIFDSRGGSEQKILKFKDNSLAKICSNFSSSTDHHHLFNVYAENTSFFYQRDRSIQYFREKDKKSKIEVKYKYNNKTKAGMLINFFDTIYKGKKNLRISENDLFYLMKICLKLVESQNKNKMRKQLERKEYISYLVKLQCLARISIQPIQKIILRK